MTKLNPKSVLAGAATAAVLTIAISGSALAHGGGMGGHMGGSIGGNLGHINATSPIQLNKVTTGTNKVIHAGDRDRRHFRFLRFGYVGVDAAPVCYYKWTSLGRVRICPSLDY